LNWTGVSLLKNKISFGIGSPVMIASEEAMHHA
jgi:hypothetical protein